MTRDAKTIDLGTFDDPEPEIHTTAYDASDSDHYVGVGTVKISDKIEYSHLVAGKTYTVIGELHDAATGDAVTVNGQAIADGEGATDSGIPTREEVRSHFAEMGFAVDPDRFFDVNEGRGWRTNSGKPVDDWKKLAAVWDRNPSRTHGTEGQCGRENPLRRGGHG